MHLLRITGLVGKALGLNLEDLIALPAEAQLPDVSSLDPKRQGGAVRLCALLRLAEPDAAADYLTLHAEHDDFHASMPLAAVYDRALVIYHLAGQPLARSQGGPLRFYIPDHAACRTHEIDECANVKYLDSLELTRGPGRDNRPAEEREHAALHARQASQAQQQ